VRAAADRLEIGPSDIVHYAQAIIRWIAAGFPVCTQEEVERRVSICRSNECGKYVDCHCALCGCNVNTSRIAVLNKAKLATEDCPDTPSRWPKDTPKSVGDTPR
jgi:hypothetical protein